MASVRRARPEDRQAVVATVVSAFAGDPAWSFLLGADYDGAAPHLAGALFDLRVGSGDVWVCDDRAAVSMWERPGGPRLPPEEAARVWGGFRAAVGEGVWQRLDAYDRCVGAARPGTPYWYLGVLATQPERQGEGLATAVMAPVLDRADRDGVACCLETSTTGNRDFYRRRGFTESVEVTVAGGPTTWWLRRPGPGERPL